MRHDLGRVAAGFITPVPVGVGTVTVAMLYFDYMDAFGQGFGTALGQEMAEKMTETAPNSKLHVA